MTLRRDLLVLLLVMSIAILVPVAVAAQTEGSEGGESESDTGPPAEYVAEPEEAAPFDAAAATEAYLGRLSAEERERSDSYFEGGYW